MKKIKTVLFEPRLIGLFFNEKMWKSLLMMFIAILITIIPAVMTQMSTKQISTSFRTTLVENVQNSNIVNTYIVDNTLIYEEQYVIEYDFFNVVIGGELGADSFYYYTILFDENDVKFYLTNIEWLSLSYEELNIDNLDFSMIKTTSVIETNKFISIFNQLYEMHLVEIAMFNVFYCFFDVTLTVFFTALFMAAIAMVFKSKEDIMSFKFRFKTCLNCQYIYLLFVLFSFLFSIFYLQYIGIILMSIYTIVATNSVRLVKKVK